MPSPPQVDRIPDPTVVPIVEALPQPPAPMETRDSGIGSEPTGATIRPRLRKPSLPLPGPDRDSIGNVSIGKQSVASLATSVGGSRHPGTAKKPASKQVVIALLDYTKNEDVELSFKKGDRFHILTNENPDWWHVRRIGDDKQHEMIEGYVPSAYVATETLEAEEWFFGKISRSEATRLLVLGPYARGTFLIRNSEHGDGGYSLTVRDHEIKHYKIRSIGGRLGIAANKTFATLHDLIEHYQQG